MSERLFVVAAVFLAASLIGCVSGGPAAQSGSSRSGGTAPVSNWKKEQLKKAMSGLSYETGRVRLSPDAAKISGPGSPAEVAAQLEKASRWLNVENEPFSAIAEATNAVIMAPKNAEALYGLALALRTKGRSEEMLAALRTALDHDPRHVAAQTLLAYTVQSGGDYSAALSEFRKVIALDPNHAEAHERAAILAFYLNDFAEAWRLGHRAEALGRPLPPQFRVMLSERMPEPPKRA
jgi:Flp pilus assembly protein TadD